jgi:RNA polymerase subunit RPABC4/transcription elongation factor Spt4
MSAKTIACPVCSGPASEDEYWTDGRAILEESYTDCPACGYQDYYEHGAHYVTVGSQEWRWWYTSTPDEIFAIRQEIAAAIKAHNATD